MVELSNPLVDFLLRSPSGWTSRSRSDTAVTALMLLGHWEISPPANAAIREGRHRIDVKLLLDLYRACPGPLRRQLVCSTPFNWLEPALFEPRFREVYGRKRLTVLERRNLAWALERYLWGRPERADRFLGLIRNLVQSSEWELRLRGLMMVGFLSDVPEDGRRQILRACRDRSHEIRCQAFNGLCEMAKRRAKLSPGLRQWCTSPEVRTIAFDRYQHDPEIDVQTCAYYFLKALEPRAGHKPPKGMPVPPPRRKRRRRTP